MDNVSHRFSVRCGLVLRRFLSVHLIAFILVSAGYVASVTASQNDPYLGQPLADVTLPTWNTWGQRLSDWRGQAIVIITLPHCSGCESLLIRYQLHLESLQHQGLTAWLAWPHTSPPPASFRLPVLRYDDGISPAWLKQAHNAVLYINPQGELDRVDALDIRRDYDSWRLSVREWLTQQAPIAHQY